MKRKFWGSVFVLSFLVLGNFVAIASAAAELQWKTTDVYFDKGDSLVIEGYFINVGDTRINHINRIDFHVDVQTDSGSKRRLTDFSVYDQNVNLNPGEQRQWKFRKDNITNNHYNHWHVDWHIDFPIDEDKEPIAGKVSLSHSKDVTLTSEEQKALELLNADRTANGLPPLRLNARLAAIARAHAADMINRKFFAHDNPDGESPFDRMSRAGLRYSYAGENIAYDQTVEKIETGWMNSPPHRANILDPNFVEVGIGMVRDPQSGSLYGVQDFFTP